ncbi:hypothetical protein [Sphingomonas panaciterrae]
MSPHEIAAMSTAAALIFGGSLGLGMGVLGISAAAAADYFIQRWRR